MEADEDAEEEAVEAVGKEVRRMAVAVVAQVLEPNQQPPAAKCHAPLKQPQTSTCRTL